MRDTPKRRRLNPMRPLSVEGSLEVLEEMSRLPEDTPARRRMMQRVNEMMELRERLEAEEAASKKQPPPAAA